MRTRTARLILAGYLGLIVYMDLASALARNGVVSLPLSIGDYYLFGEVSIITHAIAVVLIVFLFVIQRQQQVNLVRA